MARNEDQSRVSAFKRVISTKQSYSAFVPVLSHNSAGECSLYDSPLSALQDFVTNYFSGECIVEDRRALLSTHRSLNPGSPKSGKKVVFSQIQSKTLEDSFRFKQYLSPPSRKWLANLLGLSKRQVVTWFQNRRARERKRAGIRLPRHGKKCVVNFTTHTISAKEYGVSEDDEEFIDIVVQRAK